MTIDQAITEWHSKKRRMGCVAAAEWQRLVELGLYEEPFETPEYNEGAPTLARLINGE